jgi:hypothetical protein
VGWTANWVEAVGTWVGGFGTVFAVLWAIRAFRAEIRRSDAEKSEAQKLQARTVLLHDFDGVPSEDDPATFSFTLEIGNHGTLPITKIEAQVGWVGSCSAMGHSFLLAVLPAQRTETLK